MTRRYYHPDLPPAGGVVTLSESESQHAIKVMRVQVDETIDLFDGKGQETTASVCEISRRECKCVSGPPITIDREPTLTLHLGIALPKPDRAKEMIERLTELGVSSITPLTTDRTQRPPAAKLIQKLQRASIEACKQSRRNVLPVIHEPVAAAEFFVGCAMNQVRWIAHPDGTNITTLPDGVDELVAAIGPEGGWTDGEVKAANAAGFQSIGFGKRIFRIETAAAFIAARLLN